MREHICPNCGESLPRDENSAKLIKKIGLSSFKLDYAHGRWVNTPAESEPKPSLRGMVSEDVEAESPQIKLWEDVTKSATFTPMFMYVIWVRLKARGEVLESYIRFTGRPVLQRMLRSMVSGGLMSPSLSPQSPSC